MLMPFDAMLSYQLFQLSGFAEKDRQESKNREEGKEAKGKAE